MELFFQARIPLIYSKFAQSYKKFHVP